MSFWNSNDYERGNRHGVKAGREGHDPNTWRAGASMKFAIHGDKAIDTYQQGYHEGYREGCRERCRDEYDRSHNEDSSY